MLQPWIEVQGHAPAHPLILSAAGTRYAGDSRAQGVTENSDAVWIDAEVDPLATLFAGEESGVGQDR